MPYILVVDDDMDARGILVLSLQDAGFKTLGAANGVEALNFMCDPKRKTNPYLILLDLSMPVMNGYMLLNVFNRCDHMHQVPVVITSGEERPPTGYRFLKKPFSLDEVLQIAHQAYEQSRSMPPPSLEIEGDRSTRVEPTPPNGAQPGPVHNHR